MNYHYIMLVVVGALCAPIIAQDALCAGRFDLRIQGGFAPTDWIKRGAIYGVSCPALIDNQIIVKAIDFPDFNQFYSVPAVLGGQIGYSYTNSLRFFAEFNGYRARALNPNKTKFLISRNITPIDLTLDFVVSNYMIYEASVGGQYYSHRLRCSPVALFLGAKLGVTMHRVVHFSMSEVLPGVGTLILVPTSAHESLFVKASSQTIGFQGGFDVKLNDSWNLALTGEAVISSGPRGQDSVMLMPSFPIATTHLLASPIRAEVRYPITLSLRYTLP